MKTIVKAGWNADRHGCRKCRFRARNKPYEHNCQYILMMGHSRGCEVEDCDKYVRDKWIRKKKGES